MLCNIASWQVHPLKSSELIAYSLIACILQPECFKVGCYSTAGQAFNLPFCGSSQILGSPEIIPNLWKFQGPSSTPKNQKMSPEGHQQVSKWHLKSPFRHQIAESVTKVKSFKNRWFYYGLSTSSLCMLASFPSLDHQKDTWKLSPTLTPQITENHPIVPKVGPRRLPKWTQKSIQIDI